MLFLLWGRGRGRGWGRNGLLLHQGAVLVGAGGRMP
jgi:hypothetical protein